MSLRLRSVSIGELKPWKRNPRRSNDAVKAVTESIRQFGFNVPIVCDQELNVLAGHTRVEAAKTMGLARIPAIIADLKGDERYRFAIAENKAHEIAEWDTTKLRGILREWSGEDVDLTSLGFSAPELRRLLAVSQADGQPVQKLRARARTRSGDMLQLGRHRVICGDCRRVEPYERLLDADSLDLVFAGPPYFNQRSYARWRTNAAYLRDMKRVMEHCFTCLKPGRVIVWNIGNGSTTHHAHVVHHAALLEEAGFRYLDFIVWVKSGANYSVLRNAHIQRNRCFFPVPGWEALLVYQKPGPMPKMTADGARYMREHHTDVWEVPAITHQAERYGHPAVCPLELPYRAILAYSGHEATVLDPFGGSGTTLMAAEQTGRVGFLIERQRRYCDTIIARWESETDQSATIKQRV